MSILTREEAIKVLEMTNPIKVNDIPDFKLGDKTYATINEGYKMAIEALNNQKTGHWKRTTHYARPYRVCSVCGCERIDDHSTGWNYCPNCGAKMKGENNEHIRDIK